MTVLDVCGWTLSTAVTSVLAFVGFGFVMRSMQRMQRAGVAS